jgi:hypothetical protein
LGGRKLFSISLNLGHRTSRRLPASIIRFSLRHCSRFEVATFRKEWRRHSNSSRELVVRGGFGTEGENLAQVGSLLHRKLGSPLVFDKLRVTRLQPLGLATLLRCETCFWRTRENSELRLVEQPSSFVQRTPPSTCYEIILLRLISAAAISGSARRPRTHHFLRAPSFFGPSRSKD